MKWSVGALVVMVLCTLGCTNSSDKKDLRVVKEGEKRTTQTPPSESGEGKQTVAFVTNQIADFWKIAEAGCLDAQKDLGISVQVRMPAQATAVEQKRIVEDLLTSGVNGIAISPIDADNQVDWLNGIAKKVPLITHDSDAPNANRLLYIGMDNYAAGRACGELVKKALPEGGEVMLFIGRLEQDNSKYRRQGVIDVLMGRDRDIAYYKSQPNAWDPAEGKVQGDKYTVLGTITDQGKPDVAQTKAKIRSIRFPKWMPWLGCLSTTHQLAFRPSKRQESLGRSS